MFYVIYGAVCYQLTFYSWRSRAYLYFMVFSWSNQKCESLAIVQGEVIKSWFVLYVLLSSYQMCFVWFHSVHVRWILFLCFIFYTAGKYCKIYLWLFLISGDLLIRISKYIQRTLFHYLNLNNANGWYFRFDDDTKFRLSIHIIAIIIKPDKLNRQNPIYCMKDNWENLHNLEPTLTLSQCTLAGPVYTGMPLVDPVYNGIPLGDPANTSMVHWNTTGQT